MLFKERASNMHLYVGPLITHTGMRSSTHTVREKIIWSAADFVRLPTEKEIISL